MQKVSITKTLTYNQEEVTLSIRRHFELLKLKEFLQPNMRVLLKPNLLMKRKPEEITTTHPAVIAGIIVCLKELGVTDITLADSPGGPYTKQALSGIYEVSGMKKLAQEYDIKLNYDFGSFECKVENGVMVQNFTLINPIQNADFIIDIAKLKTHCMTTLSGGVKNLFGTVPGLMKPEFHFRFPDKDDFTNMLIDLCETVKPNVTFVDAIISMEGDGPSGGTPRETGLILASKSPYNLDVCLCKVINVELDTVPTVYQAIKRGLCVDNINKLDLVGDEIFTVEDYKMPNVKGVDFMNNISPFWRKVCTPFAKTFLVSKPVIQKRKCVGCGKCAESCPAQVIEIVNRKANINYKECIKCFCCHEMCPIKVIDIKRFKLFDF
ncbi:DUF362 domain-containing protein [Paludicola sp. MB14-C6]|uniref:DUF362 domain-containing protein n=1 Tax=Paludihabitans sp. MB14-C6 TaxID=3070656 RepID=UPI0027DB4CA6|nr:DUF362 domain-containing protein [Paludicola sp. MB14-C6]WMJ22621.1 DUF362 domain-containing protein [Paludicola sp. MB14-C6]